MDTTELQEPIPVGEASELDPSELDAYLREVNDAWASEKHSERMEVINE